MPFRESVSTQQAETKTTVSADTVMVAEPFEFTIEVIVPDNKQVSFDSVSESIGQFDVVAVQDGPGIPLDGEANRLRWLRQITLESIQTGTLVIPAQKVKIRDLDSQESEFVSTDRIVVNVESVLADQPKLSDYRDIKPLIDVEATAPKSFPWGIWITGAAAVLVFPVLIAGVVLWRRRQKWVQPSRWAVEQLRSLSINDGSSGQVLGQVVKILRKYLGHRLAIDANAADQDLLAAVEQRLHADAKECKQGDERVLKAILNQAEIAKFAAGHADSSQLSQTINSAIQFVQDCESSIQRLEAR